MNGDMHKKLCEQPRMPLDAAGRDEPGIYAYFFRTGHSFPEDVLKLDGSSLLCSDGLLYIGISKTSLAGRAHWRYSKSSSSTLGRTLGALLRAHHGLKAIPRNSKAGAKGKDISNFCFDRNSEDKLRDWMLVNLEYASMPVARSQCAFAERELIAEICPPLNSAGNLLNPHRAEILGLREICRNEAKLFEEER